MSQTVADLIQGKRLISVSPITPVREAVAIMASEEYSQLPVINDAGRLVGLFTERKLTQALDSDMGCEIGEFRVGQWMEDPPRLIPPTISLHKVAHMLEDTYAVIVGDDGQPIGIVTDWDIAVFLSEWSRGMALVEDIEKRLRGYIKRVFPTANARDAALYRAFGPNRTDQSLPAREYDELTLHDYVQLILTDANWARFERYFGQKDAFRKLMEQAVPIRNQIAHFRGRLTVQQQQRLENAKTYLAGCPLVQDNLSLGLDL